MADKFAPDITASTAAADNITAIRENRQAAGHYEAAGAEAGKAVGGAVSFLGTNVLSGYKGYLEAGQEREVSQVIDDAKTQISALPASSAAADNTMAAGGDNPAGQFKSETDKLYAAYKQGILTQGDLNLRVGAVTKKYSAIMPGWATDFRRQAAETVGVSGIHDYMTANAHNNDLAKADFEFALKQDQGIMASYGLENRNQITPEMRTVSTNQAAAKTQLDIIKTQREAGALADEDNGKLAAKQVAGYQAQTLIGAQELYTKFAQANAGADLTSKVVTDKLRNSLDTYVSNAEVSGMAQIDAMVSAKKENNPITFDQAKKFKDDLHTGYAAMRENMKSQDGMNLYAGALKDTKGEAEDLQHRLSIMNPLIATYKDAGQMPDMTKQFISMGMDKVAFGKVWGAPAAEAMDKWVNNPFGAKQFGATDVALRSGATTLDQVKNAVGSDVASLAFTQAGGQIAGGKGQAGDFNIFKQGNMTTPEGHAALNTVLAKGGLRSSLDALPAAEAEKQATMLYEQAGTNLMGQVQTIADLSKRGGFDYKFDRLGRLSTTSNNPSFQKAVGYYNDALATREQTVGHVADGPSLVELRMEPQDAFARIRNGEVDAASKVFAAAPETYIDPMTGVQPGGVTEGKALDEAKKRQTTLNDQALPNGEPVAGQGGVVTPTNNKTLDNIRTIEQGNNPNTVKNPNSSATGPMQIINSTWDRFKAAAADKLGIKLAEMDKTNPEHAKAVAGLNIDAGKAKLAAHGIDTVHPVDEYALHHFGDTAGPKVVAAADKVSLISLVGAKAMDANGYAHTMSVGGWRARYEDRLNK